MQTKEKAIALVERCAIGMLANNDELGNPQIKSMFKTKNDGLKTFWFCSNTSSNRAKQLKHNGSSCLYFYEFNPNDIDGAICKGLMLNGQVELSYDDELRKSFWQDGMEIYYPQGALDPDFVVIRFTAHSGNYYEGLKNESFEISETTE